MTTTQQPEALTNDQLDTMLALFPHREELWTERTRRIEARQAEIAAAEAEWDALIDELEAEDLEAEQAAASEVRTLRGLSDTAVDWIEDQHGCLEGPEAGDRFESGRTFVRTTVRVWEAIAERFDAAEYADRIVVAAYCSEAMHLVEASAQRSAAAMGRKLRKVSA